MRTTKLILTAVTAASTALGEPSLVADKFLPNDWKLKTTSPGTWEHVHLGHVPVSQPGTYLVTAQLLTMIQQSVGSPSSYFTIRAALFLDDEMVANTQTHCAISNYGLWSVTTVNPSWKVTLDKTGELDIRFSFFASPGLSYNPQFHWIGVAGGNNSKYLGNGHTWMRVEGPLQ